MIGIIGLLAAIAIMIIGAYKGLAALPLSLLAALVVILSNGMPVWESYASYYMGGYAGTYSSYLLIFIFSALYAKFMDSFGCATAVGYKLIDWFGKKNVILVSVLITSVLTYGGVSLFVCIFVVGPIMFLLFKEANLPRHLTVACLVIGSSTYTMTSLPGTPALTNIIPTQFLGTKMTAAPILGILCSIAMFVMCMVYARLQEKKAIAAGEGWTYPAHMNTGAYEIADRSTLPAAWKSFLPMIVLILFIIIGGRFISDSALLTVPPPSPVRLPPPATIFRKRLSRLPRLPMNAGNWGQLLSISICGMKRESARWTPPGSARRWICSAPIRTVTW